MIAKDAIVDSTFQWFRFAKKENLVELIEFAKPYMEPYNVLNCGVAVERIDGEKWDSNQVTRMSFNIIMNLRCFLPAEPNDGMPVIVDHTINPEHMPVFDRSGGGSSSFVNNNNNNFTMDDYVRSSILLSENKKEATTTTATTATTLPAATSQKNVLQKLGSAVVGYVKDDANNKLAGKKES
jgi:hypothetical protein